MLRMMKMELAVLKKYLKQIALTMLIMIPCLAAGMDSLTSAPGVAFLMVMFSISMSSSMYDDQNGWGPYRMAMPLTRCDVVRGRYAFNLLAAIFAASVVAMLMTAFITLGSAVELPEFLAKLAVWDGSQLEATFAATISCACIALCICSVTLPAYFKFGMTKATQYLPFIMMFLSVAPFLVLGVIGGPLLDQVKGAIGLAETTGGLGLIAFGALVISLAVYVASSLVAVRFYSSRDL